MRALRRDVADDHDDDHDVAGVDGGAYGAAGNISLFSGPVNSSGPHGPSPVVALPPGGTVTGSANVNYGPAVFIRTGGATVSSNRVPGSVTSSTSFLPATGSGTTPCLFSYPADFTASSATVTSATANFTAADVGRVVSNANLPVDANGEQHTTILTVVDSTTVILGEPAASSATGSFLTIDRGVGSCIYFSQFTANTVASTCTATAEGFTASTTFTNGQLVTLTDSNQYPTVAQNIADNPTPNLTIDGMFFLSGLPEPYTYIFNEQIIDPTTGALTVYAAHLIAKPDPGGTGGQAQGDVYLGAAKCAPFVETLPTTTTTTTTLPASTTTTTTTLPASTTTTSSTVPGSTTTTVPGSTTTTSTTVPTVPDVRDETVVSPKSVAPGGVVSITSEGWAPGSEVTVVLHSTPVTLGVLTADSAGRVDGTVTIPIDTELGAHDVQLVGTAAAGAARSVTAGITVIAASTSAPSTTASTRSTPLARTGSESAWLLWMAIGLGSGGLYLVLIADVRRRRLFGS
ncbi:MAG: hypothetical protein ABIV94_11580 [Acidimicrobiales bacterium]